MLTGYGKREWLIILGLALLLAIGAVYLQWWFLLGIIILVTLALLSFFRDPIRTIPTDRNIMVSPADGVVSSVHQVDPCDPLGEPAVCVRIFLSVLDVHVNRCPCHGKVLSVTHKPGEHLNVLNPQSAKVNESNMMVLGSPQNQRPIAAINQIAGLIARRIVCAAKAGDILQRGQRYGMIKFGSTTELYVPMSSRPEVLVKTGDRVYGGSSILVRLPAGNTEQDNPEPARGTNDLTPPVGDAR